MTTQPHYSPAVKANGMLYVSGQLPIDKTTGQLIGNNIAEQTRQALQNFQAVLTEYGCDKHQVVQCRVYIADIQYWDIVNQIYAEFFGEHKPSRTIVPCGILHFGAFIEIEAIAELEEN